MHICITTSLQLESLVYQEVEKVLLVSEQNLNVFYLMAQYRPTFPTRCVCSFEVLMLSRMFCLSSARPSSTNSLLDSLALKLLWSCMSGIYLRMPCVGVMLPDVLELVLIWERRLGILGVVLFFIEVKYF
ncbi:Hypothetical_protein [Hexamita inflata]|uniref:Hypothetical_protein n=1 Tax=Hexamita inflata TaxID=28002 RepID=A0AA86R1G4_9EUKA|nr:Hypothetical protein HINF_LOCUS55002 [Hexamita inflata]